MSKAKEFIKRNDGLLFYIEHDKVVSCTLVGNIPYLGYWEFDFSKSDMKGKSVKEFLTNTDIESMYDTVGCSCTVSNFDELWKEVGKFFTEFEKELIKSYLKEVR